MVYRIPLNDTRSMAALTRANEKVRDELVKRSRSSTMRWSGLSMRDWDCRRKKSWLGSRLWLKRPMTNVCD